MSKEVIIPQPVREKEIIFCPSCVNLKKNLFFLNHLYKPGDLKPLMTLASLLEATVPCSWSQGELFTTTQTVSNKQQ